MTRGSLRFRPSGLLLLLLLLWVSHHRIPVHAFPTGAGSCLTGQASVGGSHLTTAGAVAGSVSLDEGFVVSVDDQLLMAGTAGMLSTTSNQEHTLSIFRPTAAVKGFNILVTLNSTTNTSNNNTNNTSETNPTWIFTNLVEPKMQDQELCDDDPTVVGLTHTNNQDKLEVVTTFLIDLTVPGDLVVDLDNNQTAPLLLRWTLDVTLVGQNSNGISQYYYSPFELEVRVDHNTTSTSEAPSLEEAMMDHMEHFSLWWEALEVANITDTLESLEALTVLAPTNDAITAQVPVELWTKFTTDPEYRYHLLDLVLYHVIPGRVLEVTDRALSIGTLALESLGGDVLDFVDGTINDQTRLVEQADGEILTINITNGIVYGVDGVLGRTQLVVSALSLLEAFNAGVDDPPYSILMSLLEAADPALIDLLSDPSSTVTLFVAVNSAWEAAYSFAELEALQQPAQLEELNALLRRHMIVGRSFIQEQWINNATIAVASGDDLSVTAASSLAAEEEGAVPAVSSTIANVPVSFVNRFVTNGVLHAIDGIFMVDTNLTTAFGTEGNETTTNVTLIPPPQVVCELCNGGTFNDNFVFPGAVACGILGNETGVSLVDSDDDCYVSRALAAGYCGCTFPDGVCNVCAGTFTRELPRDALIGLDVEAIIPGEIPITCGDLFTLPAMDLDDTCGVLAARYARYCGCPGALAETVGMILEETESLSFFDSALKALDVDEVLSSSGENFTIFAPNDRAIQSDELLEAYTLNMSSWSGHLSRILENHIVGGSSLSTGDLFSGAYGSLTSLSGGVLSIDKRGQTINNQSIILSDLGAFDGFVHGIPGILHFPWHESTIFQSLRNGLQIEQELRQLQATESFSILLGLLGQTGLTNDSTLVNISPNGTTLVAPTDDAFKTVTGEDAAAADRVNGILYHMIESNVYLDELATNEMAVLSTRHPEADILLTRGVDDVVRYNNVTVKQESFARNGLVHVAEQVLQPPTIVQIVEYVNEYTNSKLNTLQSLMGAAGWQDGWLSSHIDRAERERHTLLAPNDNTMDMMGVSGDFLDRLMTPAWSRHLQSLLKNLVLELPLIKEEVPLSGLFVESVGGDSLSVEQAAIAQSISGIDGIVHVIGDELLISQSLSENALEYLSNNLRNATRFANLTSQAGVDIGNANEITLFTPFDESFDSLDLETMSSADLANTLENHIFEGLFFYDNLQEMDGDIITSLNGENWIVSVLAGDVFLSSENDGDSVRVLAPGDVLVRDGVINFVDGVLENGLTQAPTVSPTNDRENGSDISSSSAQVGAQNCSACDGPIDTNATLPDGSPCSLWQWEVSQLSVDADECLLERIVAVQSCGCIPPENATQCEFCAEPALTPLRELPDTRGLTCASISSLVSVDGAATCDLINTKYASFCGCDGAEAPACTFCEAGEAASNPFLLPNETEIQLNYRVFGNLANTSCQGFADYFAVQSPNSCRGATKELIDDMPFDIRAWCECPGATTLNRCGDFCPKGRILQGAHVVDKEMGLSCKYYSDIFEFVTDDNTCEEAESLRTACCALPIVAVNTSFAVFNEQGLTVTDLIESRETLTSALEGFAESLVMKGNAQDAGAGASARRQLSTTYQTDSATIFAVQSAGCPINAGIPFGSNCHNVFGQFNVIVEDEEAETVQAQYTIAADEGVKDGTLQENFDAVDPEYAFRVAGQPITASDAVQGSPNIQNPDIEDTSNQELSWWIILFIVLACVSGLCGFAFLLAFWKTRRQVKKIHYEDEFQAPMTEVSVVMKVSEELSKDEEDGGNVEGVDNSFSDSNFWAMNESEPMEEQNSLLEANTDKQADELEQAPVSVEDDGSDSEVWEDEDPKQHKDAGVDWDEGDDDENKVEWNDPTETEDTEGEKDRGRDIPEAEEIGNESEGAGNSPSGDLIAEPMDKTKIEEPSVTHELKPELAPVDGRAFETDEIPAQQSYSEIVESNDAWSHLHAAVATAAQPGATDVATETSEIAEGGEDARSKEGESENASESTSHGHGEKVGTSPRKAKTRKSIARSGGFTTFLVSLTFIAPVLANRQLSNLETTNDEETMTKIIERGTLHCWIGLIVTPAFLCLTGVAILSTLIPFLRELALHGKHRVGAIQDIIPKIGPSNTSSLIAKVSQWKSAFLHDDLWLINKQYFLHFYVAGLFSLAFFLFNTPQATTTTSKRSPWDAFALLVIHLLRRCYECLVVHRYSHKSKMHLAGYICGMFHYIFLPYIMFEVKCNSSAGDTETMNRYISAERTLEYHFVRTMCWCLCGWGQFEQYNHHRLLASLRQTPTENKDNTRQDLACTHKIPKGRWFKYVSCPHYSAEILVYIAFAGMCLLQASKSVENQDMASCEVQEENDGSCLLDSVPFLHPVVLDALVRLREFRQYVLVLWVASNLTVTALRSHRWYLQAFPTYEKLNRKAIIPKIL